MGWASNISGIFTGHNAREAANDAYNQLEKSKTEANGYLSPYNQAGQQAIAPLTGLLTGSSYDPKTGQSTQLSQDQRNNLFYQNPGYQFSLDQALKAMNASFAAKGNLLSGGATKEIGQYASGYAAQNSNDYIGQLFQLLSGGEQAATGQANVTMGVASPEAQAQYSGGIASQNAGTNILNTAGGIGGGILQAYIASQTGGKLPGSGGNNSGVVNMSPFLAAEGQ